MRYVRFFCRFMNMIRWRNDYAFLGENYQFYVAMTE